MLFEDHQFAGGPERAEQFELLLENNRSVTRLLDKSLGGVDLLEDAGGNELLDDMLRATAELVDKEWQEKLEVLKDSKDKKMRRMKVDFDDQLMAHKTEIEEQSEQIEGLQDVARSMHEEIGTRRNRELILVNKAIEGSNKFTKIADYLLSGLIILVAAFAIINGFQEGEGKYNLITASGYVFLIIGAYHIIQNIRGRETIGFKEILNILVKWRFDILSHNYGVHGTHYCDLVQFENGRVYLQSDESADKET